MLSVFSPILPLFPLLTSLQSVCCCGGKHTKYLSALGVLYLVFDFFWSHPPHILAKLPTFTLLEKSSLTSLTLKSIPPLSTQYCIYSYGIYYHLSQLYLFVYWLLAIYTARIKHNECRGWLFHYIPSIMKKKQ